jgi:hypothetical protein
MSTCSSCNDEPDACTCPSSIRSRMTVIHEAARLVSTDREAEHGDFRRNAETASDLLHDLGINVGVCDLPLVLMALKLARHRANPANRDNIVDAIGYLGLYARLTGLDEA